MERDYFCESYSICCVCKKRIYGIPRSFPNGAGLYCNNCFANKQAEFDFKPSYGLRIDRINEILEELEKVEQ